jgi:hypothetical protein
MSTNDEILKSMQAVLEPAGFSNSGDTFHRVIPAQFVDVVSLQAGLRGLAGRSAVNLGIYIPEVKLLLGRSNSIEEARANETPRESQCMIRQRLSSFVFGKDIWFDHNDPVVGQKISGLLLSHVLLWFEKLGTITAIAGELKAGRRPFFVGWGGHAAILKAAGETEAVRSFLKDLPRIPKPMIEALAAQLGIDLMPTKAFSLRKLQEDNRKILFNFFAAHFHQDWICDSETPDEVLTMYLRDAPQQEVGAVVRAILRLIDCDYGNEALEPVINFA